MHALNQADNTRTGSIQVLLGAITISFSPVFVRLSATGPAIDGFYRMFLGGVILLLVVLFQRDSLWRGTKPFIYAVLAAAFLSADLLFWHYSIDYVGPGLSTILLNLQVFFLVIASIVIYREIPNLKFIFALLLAVLGMFMLVGLNWTHQHSTYKIGVYLGLSGAILYAVFIMLLRTSQLQKKGLSPLANLTLISFVSAALFALVANLQHESFAIPDISSGIWLFCYALFGQVLGWLLISKGIPKIAAPVGGILLLLQPTLAFIWDNVFFQRVTPWYEWMGALIALIAIYLGSTTYQRKK